MPLASITAHWLAGWEPAPPPPAATADAAGGASPRPHRYTPKPIKNARHRQYSTLYATADAATRKLVRSAETVGLRTAADAELAVARSASAPSPAGTSSVELWSRRTVAAAATATTETGVRAVAGLAEGERAARHRYRDSQFLLIVDEDSR